jgi:hypothetical protein
MTFENLDSKSYVFKGQGQPFESLITISATFSNDMLFQSSAYQLVALEYA